MGKLQRDRGAIFEREICKRLGEEFGFRITRKLGQARDGGDDIEVGPFMIECKRRKGIAVYEWLAQVQLAADVRGGATGHTPTPIVIARADGEPAIVIMSLDDFIPLMRGELGNASPPEG